jgi:tRNA A37 methylthiotransferase MiaB
VLIDEYGKNNSIIGRNDNYKQVIIKDLPSDAGLGDFVNVKIVAVEKYHLVGEYKAGLQQHHAEPYKS